MYLWHPLGTAVCPQQHLTLGYPSKHKIKYQIYESNDVGHWTSEEEGSDVSELIPIYRILVTINRLSIGFR